MAAGLPDKLASSKDAEFETEKILGGSAMKKRIHILSTSFYGFLVTSFLFVTSSLVLALSTSNAYSAEVILAWNSVAKSDGYKVYHGSTSGGYLVPEDVGNQTSHSLSLDPGEYYFAVTAYNNYGESGYSEEVSCTIQEANPVTYVVVASAGGNGSISPAGEVTVEQGADKAFTIIPDTNYHVEHVLVDGTSVGSVTSYTFSNVTQNHTIAASFAVDTRTVLASSGDHGIISPSGTITLNQGSDQTFTIIPDQNYHITDLIVDGVFIGAQTSHTFSNVTQDHTISANFAIDTYVIFASAGDFGSINPGGSVTVNHDADRTFIFIPDKNYQVADVVVDGMSVGAVTSYTFYDVRRDHAIFSSFTRANQTPVADAGPDQSVDEGVSVTLGGANSSDPDPDDAINYYWEQIGGQTISLLDSNAAITTFDAPSVGPEGDALVFRLTVTDSGGLQSSDTCIINVSSTNIQPTADAGPNQKANEGETVTLDGSGSADPDGDIVKYMWEQIAGPRVDLSDHAAARPAFTAPDVGTEGVSLTFQLTVEDDGGLKSTDNCIVNISWVNTPPIADAGPDQTAVEGSVVTLDGLGSVDSDDGIASYRWIQTGGNPVTLSDPMAVKSTFTVPYLEQEGNCFIFELTVKDNGRLEDTDACIIYATSTTNQSPIPDIKANGQDGEVSISYGAPVQITIRLDPGDCGGQKADWWISVLTPDGSWNSYILRREKWVSGIRQSFGGKIKSCSREVLNTADLSPGVYIFYFAVDNNFDRKIDSTWLDSVKVHVE